MGQKTHPIGFRLGTTVPWHARWFAARGTVYSAQAIEDQRIRDTIKARYEDTGGISRTEIERGPQELVVSIHTARPGIVIGRGGQRVDELRADLERLTGKRARLNIQEIRQPELDAYLVARNVAEQLERRVAFRRAMRQAVTRTMQAGAEGIRLQCSGRLGGAEIARSEKAMDGRVPLHTLRANIDFAVAEAATTFGRIGVKAWIYKGDEAVGAAIIGTAMRQTEAPADEQQQEERPRRQRRASPARSTSRTGARRSRAAAERADAEASAEDAEPPTPVATEEAAGPEAPAGTPAAEEETAAIAEEQEKAAEAAAGDPPADDAAAETEAAEEAAEEAGSTDESEEDSGEDDEK